MASTLKLIGLILAGWLGGQLFLVFVGLAFLELQQIKFPEYSIIGSLAFILVLIIAYYTGRRKAIISYNKKLITKGTWIRATTDITVRTSESKFTIGKGVLAYVFNTNKNLTYDLLFGWDGFPHEALREFSDYRRVEIVPIEEVDENAKSRAAQKLQELTGLIK